MYANYYLGRDEKTWDCLELASKNKVLSMDSFYFCWEEGYEECIDNGISKT